MSAANKANRLASRLKQEPEEQVDFSLNRRLPAFLSPSTPPPLRPPNSQQVLLLGKYFSSTKRPLWCHIWKRCRSSCSARVNCCFRIISAKLSQADFVFSGTAASFWGSVCFSRVVTRRSDRTRTFLRFKKTENNRWIKTKNQKTKQTGVYRSWSSVGKISYKKKNEIKIKIFVYSTRILN